MKGRIYVVLSDGSTYALADGCRLVVLNDQGEEKLEYCNDFNVISKHDIKLSVGMSAIKPGDLIGLPVLVEDG